MAPGAVEAGCGRTWSPKEAAARSFDVCVLGCVLFCGSSLLKTPTDAACGTRAAPAAPPTPLPLSMRYLARARASALFFECRVSVEGLRALHIRHRREQKVRMGYRPSLSQLSGQAAVR